MNFTGEEYFTYKGHLHQQSLTTGVLAYSDILKKLLKNQERKKACFFLKNGDAQGSECAVNLSFFCFWGKLDVKVGTTFFVRFGEF